MNVELLRCNEKELKEWWKYFAKLGTKGVYHQPDYVKFLQEHYYEDSEAELFVCGNEDEFIYYPYFKRSLATLPLKTRKIDLSRYYDIVSSWYYGGPLICASPGNKDLIAEHFVSYFNTHCRKSNIVTSFDRLDPNLKNHKIYERKEGVLTQNRLTVYVDLTEDEETIWRELGESCKRNLRKAGRSNLEIVKYQSPRDIRDFWEIYDGEMVRKNAVQRLRFPRKSFEELFTLLPGNADLLLAKSDGRVVGGFIIAHNKEIAHHFLSASLPEVRGERVNELLYYSVILHAKKMGCRIFDFQGGREGVFRFKSKFSQDRGEFYTYSMVWDQEIYECLVKAAEEEGADPDNDYFPRYRAAICA